MTSETVMTPAFRTALLRRYVTDAFISLMTRVNGKPVYIEDGETVLLTTEKVALNILFHIEVPWMDEFGMEDGNRLAAEMLERMLAPGFMGEALRLSVEGVTEMREVYRDIIFGPPDGELPAGYEFVLSGERETSQ